MLTESNKEFPITPPLVWGQGEDASHIVTIGRLFFLGKKIKDEDVK